jgi:hypothetical protein
MPGVRSCEEVGGALLVSWWATEKRELGSRTPNEEGFFSFYPSRLSRTDHL